MKKYIISIIVMGGLALIAPWTAEAATLSLSPVAGNFTVGSIFTANIVLDTQGQVVGGADIRYLNYNPALLEAQDENMAVVGVQITPGNLMPDTTYNEVDVANGRIAFSQMISGNNTFSGSGVLAAVRFKVLNAGSTNVNFDFTPGNTADTNVAQAGADVLNAVTNGAYILSALPPPPPPPTSLPTLSLIPSAEQDPTGASFPVRIYLDTKGRAIDGVDVILNFDRTRLEVEDVDGMAAGIQIAAGSLLSNTTRNEALSSYGRVSFSQTTSGGSTFSGSGVLATVYFKALAEGIAPVTFSFVKSVTSDTNVSFGGADILDSVTNGSYTIISNGLAPIISGPQPTGTIFMPRTLTLKVSTNEAATCRYGSTPNAPYDSMTRFFSASFDGLTHTASLFSGFQLGPNSFYVRCKDKGGAANQSDFLISFNIITDTIAPIISSPQPTGTIFMPRTLTLKVSTNEAATCRYGPTPNTSYDLMTRSFSASSDGLSHTATLSSGFQLGSNSFYVRCKDKASGNTNQSDYVTSFNLLTPPKFFVGLEETNNPSYANLTLSMFNSGVGSPVVEFTVRPDSAGLLPLPAAFMFAPKSYDIVIISPNHLKRRVVNIEASAGATISLPTLSAGDLNADGIVNSLDWSMMDKNWATSNSSADINRDRVVNSLDWGYLRKNWLKRGDN